MNFFRNHILICILHSLMRTTVGATLLGHPKALPLSLLSFHPKTQTFCPPVRSVCLAKEMYTVFWAAPGKKVFLLNKRGWSEEGPSPPPGYCPLQSSVSALSCVRTQGLTAAMTSLWPRQKRVQGSLQGYKQDPHSTELLNRTRTRTETPVSPLSVGKCHVAKCCNTRSHARGSSPRWPPAGGGFTSTSFFLDSISGFRVTNAGLLRGSNKLLLQGKPEHLTYT